MIFFASPRMTGYLAFRITDYLRLSELELCLIRIFKFVVLRNAIIGYNIVMQFNDNKLFC